MAYTQTDVDKLKAAIATGAREVWYGDKRVAYRSLTEMKEVLSTMEAEVSGKKVSRRRRIVFSKGT
jgi:hypothetical protein